MQLVLKLRVCESTPRESRCVFQAQLKCKLAVPRRRRGLSKGERRSKLLGTTGVGLRGARARHHVQAYPRDDGRQVFLQRARARTHAGRQSGEPVPESARLGSDISQSAVTTAVDLAKMYGATLVALSVKEPFPYASYSDLHGARLALPLF